MIGGIRNCEKSKPILQAFRIWEGFRLAFSSERGFANASLGALAEASPWKRKKIVSAFVGANPAAWLFMLIPRCVFRKINYERSNLDELIERVRPDGFDPDTLIRPELRI